jgi:hypothetical protein
MRSHIYDFKAADVIRLLAAMLVPVVAFAALMHMLGPLHLLPKPRPTLDLDRTIIVHKAEASRSRSDAQVILVGDSSCLMNVSARLLSEEVGAPVLNLGTLSYLDLEAHAALLNRFASANPNQVKAVVLLLHPEALRRPAPEVHHLNVLKRFLAGEDHITKRNLSRWCGLEIFRGRIFARALSTPLPGAYGRYYGFTSDFENYLSRNNGSAVDPDPRVFQGSPEYRLAAQLEAGSRLFKTAVPTGVKLLVGITPVPAGFAGADHTELHRQMLVQWNQWLQADAALNGLPAVLPNDLFAKTTHLNSKGAITYTRLLAPMVRAHFAPATSP